VLKLMIQGSRNKNMVAKKKLIMVVFLVVLVTSVLCEEGKSCKLKTYGKSVISLIPIGHKPWILIWKFSSNSKKNNALCNKKKSQTTL
jgi:hypothetical protein